jgi:hypothetical protein
MRMDRLEQLIEKLERQNKSEIVDAIVREGQPIPPGARRVLIIQEEVVSVEDLSEHGTVPIR